MKILFLHTASDGLTAEYRVHATLALHTPAGSAESHFAWQDPVFTSGIVPVDRVRFCEFGRNLSIPPQGGRIGRAVSQGRSYFGARRFLLDYVREIRPDLVYTSQQTWDIHWADLLSRRFRIPHVVHLHYNVGPWLGRRALEYVRRSRRLIAVSEYIRQTAMLAGVPEEHVYTLVNPTPASEPSPQGNAAALRAEFGFTEETPMLVSVGRLDRGKGHLALFDAFALVVEDLPSARLVVCGKSSSGPDYEMALRDRVRQLRLDDRVTFAGFRRDARAIMRSADVFCLPTELEPCALVFLEAGAEGIPCVAVHSGGVPEVIQHDVNGLLSYPRDTRALADNLLRVLADRSYSRRLGAKAQELARTRFAPADAAQRWVRILESFA